MGTKTELEKGIDEAVTELEGLSDELKVKLHLAGMDMSVMWSEDLEPLLFSARTRAKEATQDSLIAIREAVEKFRRFARAQAASLTHSPTLTVGALMSSDVATVRAEDVASRAAQIMWDRACGAVPVVDDSRRPIAMLTDRDISMAAYIQGRTLDGISVASAMSKRILTVRDFDKIAIAEGIMRRHSVRRLPVVDKEGAIVGILSLDDILRRAPLVPVRYREPLSPETLLNTAAAVAHAHSMNG